MMIIIYILAAVGLIAVALVTKGFLVDKKGIDYIRAERQKQLRKYENAEDDRHTNGQLVKAAIYALTQDNDIYPDDWTFTFKNSIKDREQVDRLSIAGALIAAEIDRVVRADAELEILEDYVDINKRNTKLPDWLYELNTLRMQLNDTTKYENRADEKYYNEGYSVKRAYIQHKNDLLED